MLEGPEVPKELVYVWNLFMRMGGSETLSWLEIDAWSRLNRVELTAFELDCLRRLDNVRSEVANDRRQQSTN